MRVLPVLPARNSRPLQSVVAFISALVIVFGVTGFVWAQSDIRLDVDGRSRSVDTQAATVAEVLAQESVDWDADDVVTPPVNTLVKPGMTILVRHAITVTIATSAGSYRLAVAGDTVADALAAAGMPTSGTSAVTPPVTTRLREGMRIDVPDAFVRVISQTEEVAPPMRVVKDITLKRGAQRVASKGVTGKTLRVYRTTVVSGTEGPLVLVTERVIRRPKARVIAVGAGGHTALAYAAPMPAPKPGHGESMRVEATAYSPRQAGLDFVTATGRRAGRGVVAVDPSVIPLGTRMYVPGYGYAVAADTGGAVRGRRIDVCFDRVSEAIRWGRRDVTIVILK